MKWNFLPRLLVDVDSSDFLALLMQELSDVNPVLLQFVIEETGKIEEKTEKERTLLAALIGIRTLGASDKNDPDYIEVSERSIREAQQQICVYKLGTVNKKRGLLGGRRNKGCKLWPE